mmetsp:Transcript_14183/g.34567  ORF Transcript_14183/g.34567 Transcript_14183/m.34567 type:complete len:561 (+) Transcript_14183:164-1846(+)
MINIPHAKPKNKRKRNKKRKKASLIQTGAKKKTNFVSRDYQDQQTNVVELTTNPATASGNTETQLPTAHSKKKRKKSKKDKTQAITNQLTSSESQLKGISGVKAIDIKDPRRGFAFFSWLIHPTTPQEFHSKNLEKEHLLIRRGGPVDEKGNPDPDGEHYYSGFYSSGCIRDVLRDPKQEIIYGRDIDVTKFYKNKRKTLNPEGRADPDYVWKKFSEGCSVRVLRPHEYSDNVHSLVALMDEYWGRVAGANAYLTPSSTQGFAPHYDDVDVYILQLEGRKRWRLYPPRDESGILPRFSSEDFDAEELPKPFLDTVLNPGDLLYAPRGTIHQAVALPGGPPSLHLTLSTGQRHTWADFFSIMLPRAVELAADDSPEFRKSLPISFHDYMGVMHSDKKNLSGKRDKFKATVSALLKKLMDEEYLPLDAAADQVARDFTHGRVPPLGVKRKQKPQNQHKVEEQETPSITKTMRIALVAKGCARVMMEDEAAVLYYCVNNSRAFKEREEQSLPFADHCAPALERIITSFPRYVSVSELEGLEDEEQLIVANVLFEAGIVTAKKG